MNWICRTLCLCAMLGMVGQEDAVGEKGFDSIFDGRSLDGWRVMGNPEGWKVEEGCLHSDGGKGGEGIRTQDAYGNFVLRFDWMLSKVGNSGVFIKMGEDGSRGPGFEVQLLAPWTPRRDDLHCTASLYGHVPVQNRPDETTERWRSMEIVCDRRQVTVKVDGELCTEADMDRVESLRGKAVSGCIGFQDSHTGQGEWVRFRKIRIKELDREADYVIAGFSHPHPGTRRQAHLAAGRLGRNGVMPLLEAFSSSNPMVSTLAETALFDLCVTARDRGGREQRKFLSKLKRGLRKAPSPRARAEAARLLGLFDETGRKRCALKRAARRSARRDELELEQAAKGALLRMGEPK